MIHTTIENNRGSIGSEEQDKPPLIDAEIISSLHDLTLILISQMTGKRKKKEYLKTVIKLKTPDEKIVLEVCRIAYMLISGVAEEKKKNEYLKIVDAVITRINE